MSETHKKTRRRRIMAAAAILTALGIYVLVEPYWLKVRRMTISSPDIPPAFDGKTILFASDIHHGPFFSRERVASLVRTINALGADLILLGGDYVHREPKYIGPCFEELAGLGSPLGVYGVLGNHDHWEDAVLTRKCMEDAGIGLIENRAEWIALGEDRIRIGGVGDYWEELNNDVGPTIEGADESDFVLLISHNPDYVEEILTIGGAAGDVATADSGVTAIDATLIDLVLAGHTHGGQVSFFGLWAPLVPSQYGQKYRTGIVETGQTKVIISNGVGTITPPVRFCTRPDVLLITLRHEMATDVVGRRDHVITSIFVGGADEDAW